MKNELGWGGGYDFFADFLTYLVRELINLTQTTITLPLLHTIHAARMRLEVS